MVSQDFYRGLIADVAGNSGMRRIRLCAQLRGPL